MTALLRATKRMLAALAILAVLGVITGTLILRSGWFRERVRERIVSELERATGGRAELGTVAFDWPRLIVTVSPLVLHGREAEDEAPLLRIPNVTVGLRLISLLARDVDLASLRIDQPAVHIAFYEDGSNNLPSPAVSPGGKSWAESLIDLAVRRYEVNDGVIEYDLERIPLSVRGEELKLRMDYAGAGPGYRGALSSKRLRISTGSSIPAELSAAAEFTLLKNSVDVTKLEIGLGQSRATLSGTVSDLRSPRGKFAVKSKVALPDITSLLSLPISPAGTASLDGDIELSVLPKFDYNVRGRLVAQGLGYTKDRLNLRDVSLTADVRANPQGAHARFSNAQALGAKIQGQADFDRYQAFHLEGRFESLNVRDAAAIMTDRAVPWSGYAAGDASIDTTFGRQDTRATVRATVTPSSEGTPIEGRVELDYDQRAATLRLGNTRLATPATQIQVSGTLGDTLQVEARSTNLDDILPALQWIDATAPRQLPIRLDNGDASLTGSVTGKLDHPQFRGQAALNRVVWQGRLINRATGDIDASPSSIAVRRLAVTRGALLVNGDARIDQRSGSLDDGSITAQLNIRNLALAEADKEFQLGVPVTGTAAGTVRAAGTLQNPILDATINVPDAAGYGEQFGLVRAAIHYENGLVKASSVEATVGMGRVTFSGEYQHAAGDFKNGTFHGQIGAQGVVLSRVNALRERIPYLDARLDASPEIYGRLSGGNVILDSFNGKLTARGVSLNGEPLGDLVVNAETKGNQMTVQATGGVRGTNVQGQGTWRLDSGAPGSGSIQFARMNVSTLYTLVMAGSENGQRPGPPPFDGFLEGSATFSFPLRSPEAFQAEARITTLEMSARATQALRLGAQPQDVTIRNDQPIVVSLTRAEARIKSAHLVARQTNLEATGTVPFRANGGADLALKGTVNLAVLQLLNPDLLATGNAVVAASIRGSIRNPQLNGRMELNGASLYLADIPNGIDNASGVILFDRNRATVEKLSAETGGGTVGLGGFLEFGQPLIYRLRADVRQVRVRYPEDVSMTVGAQLTLNGTSDASLLAGTLTMNRAAINTGADLGRILASNSGPSTSVESDNEYLRGVRFDVKIDSTPTFELETSLTRNVQAAVDLRLRGTATRPVLAGDVSVNSGEVELFGTRYSVNRGDIRFLNPVRIEPTLDVNLETRARGITVTVSLSGTPQRLNVNYSSDPPLQSREIIALLAVGRDPTTNSQFSSSQLSGSSSAFSDAGGLLGQAVAQQLSNRLQRFFGASRVKIDPTMTGVDNLPEARLTLEQQISRDITLTYITNLNRTQEQIVRVEWDLSPQWSAVAVRKANGLFGIDFQYRKRFK